MSSEDLSVEHSVDMCVPILATYNTYMDELLGQQINGWTCFRCRDSGIAQGTERF